MTPLNLVEMTRKRKETSLGTDRAGSEKIVTMLREAGKGDVT